MMTLIVVSFLIGLPFSIWFTGLMTGILNMPGETKQRERMQAQERARQERMTATEIWLKNRDLAPLPSIRDYLIAKHGDNIAAADAWERRRSKDLDALVRESLAWRNTQKK